MEHLTELLYFENPLLFTFTAKVIAKRPLHDQEIAIALDRTCFCPAGGGQEHDIGTINEVQVINVFKDEDGIVWHVVDSDIPDANVSATVDKDRRMGHMQSHSAQHILTQCFERLLNLETVSVRIATDMPSSIDLATDEISPADILLAEDCANETIYENRWIKSYFIAESEIGKIPFRRTPAITGRVRVVEVDGFDYAACGGTHCMSTGMVGIIKTLKAERRGAKVRVQFVAGKQALHYFRRYQRTVADLVGILNVNAEEILASVTRQADQLQATKSELDKLHTDMVRIRAQDLVNEAAQFAGHRLLLAGLAEWRAKDLRELAGLLQLQSDLVALLVGRDADTLTLVICCGDRTGISAKNLLDHLLRGFSGRGGGTAKISQGSVTACWEQVEVLFTTVRAYLEGLTKF